MARTTLRAGGGKRWLALVVVAALAAAGYYGWKQHEQSKAAVEYRSALVVRGAITASVSASGTLNPVTSVQVGSQVSGQLKEVLVDYNTEVREGQVIARIDPETFEYRVRQSQADVDAARAQVLTAQANVSAARAAVSRAEVNLAENKRDLDRKQQLVERSFISSAELEKARATYNAGVEDLRSARAQQQVAEAQARSAQAAVKQREAQLSQSRVDLERTTIRAPVDGIVIKRSVDAGQTVAASLQAPELFIIARNLRDMQVDTSVDEAEIGKIRPGQRASFTVDSFPGRHFTGEVVQVRKAAVTVQNVVTYTVVVSAENPDLSLIPGMTANVRITTDTRDSVLKVPNAALRFRPPDFQEPAAAGSTAPTAAAPGASPGGTGGTGGAAGGSNALRQLRDRLERELSMTEAQRQQLDAIFAGMREKFAAVRAAPEADRARLSERNRAEIRERITEILSPEQRKRYGELIAESANRPSSQGRVFVLDAQGLPAAVTVRTGLTDGSFTEVRSDLLKEGDKVLIGTGGPAGQSARPSAPAGPRMPF
jgi:HlyD family secretion protein